LAFENVLQVIINNNILLFIKELNPYLKLNDLVEKETI
jgi:hypothetical protein